MEHPFTVAGRLPLVLAYAQGDRETAVIYCVVPPELGEDAYKRLVEHYRDNPNVKVIMDRRHGERRRDRTGGGERETRDRRRRRLPGSLDV